MMEYYRITQNMTLSGVIQLGKPLSQVEQIDPRLFTRCTRTGVDELLIPVARPGALFDFLFAPYDMPIVSEKFVDLIVPEIQGDFQLIECTVEGVRDRYWIFNVISCLDCLDFSRSDYSYWQDGDGIPSKVGKLRSLDIMSIDPNKVDGEDVFRIFDWKVALIGSQGLVEKISRYGITGVSCTEIL